MLVAKPASSPDLDSQLPSPEAAQTEHGKTEKKETLSQMSDDQLIPSLGRRPSTSVPWEKDGKEAEETSEEAGQLRQGVSLCPVTSAFQQDLHGSEGNASGNQAAAGDPSHSGDTRGLCVTDAVNSGV